MGTKHQSVDPNPDKGKRRRVGFAVVDPGIEAKKCIDIYLVSSKDEVDSLNGFKIEPVDLDPFFEDEGKIYGYLGLKITVWLSSISFHAFADISFESSSDGGKGVTDLKSFLKEIFAENLVENKDEFLQTFSTGNNYIESLVSDAEVLPKISSNGCNSFSSSNFLDMPDDLEVVRVCGTGIEKLYCRLVPLVLLLVDGSNPIDVTDPRWEIYVLVQRNQKDSCMSLLGFAVVYRFHKYPSSMRLRLGQILVIPPYQRMGYGSHLLRMLNNVAISDDVYDFTIEEPVNSLQHVRTCIDVQRLLGFAPVQQALKPVVSQLKYEDLSKKSRTSRCKPSAETVEQVRQSLKITRRQFLYCWDILIYLSLDSLEMQMENYHTILRNRIEADVIGKESEGAGKLVIDIPTEFDPDASFVMIKVRDVESTSIARDEVQEGFSQEEQLKQLVDERMKEIKAVAQKISSVYRLKN